MKSETAIPLMHYFLSLILGEVLALVILWTGKGFLPVLLISVAVFLISRRAVKSTVWLVFFFLGATLQFVTLDKFEPMEIEYVGYVSRGGTGIVEAAGGKILLKGDWVSLYPVVKLELSNRGASLHTGQVVWAGGTILKEKSFPLYRIDASQSGHFDRFPLLSFPSKYSRDLLKKYNLGKTVAGSVFLGERNALERETKTAITELGIAHLFAVSGLHIGLMYLLLNYILSSFLLGRRTRLCICVSLLAVYTLSTGPSISATRTFLMLAIYSFFRLIDYEQQPLNTLGLAGIIMALAQPSVVASVSFQLSFFATAALLIFLPMIERRNLFVQALLVGAVAQIAIIPLSLSVFGTLSLVSVPLSVVMVPLFIIPSYIGILTVLLLDAVRAVPLCEFIAAGLSMLSELFEGVVLTVANFLPALRFQGGTAYLIALVLLAVSFFSLWHFGHRP